MQAASQHGDGMDEIERLLLRLFGTGNPVWSWGVLPPSALGAASDGGKPPAWHGCPDTVRAAHGDIAGVRLPDHVFPVVSTIAPGRFLGLTVPVSAEPRARWHVSDAFGRFVENCGSVDESFEHLLQTIERAWRDTRGGVLPLRWRQPFAFQVLANVHLGSIAGESLQWPLAVALLRAAASGGDPGHLPFGRGPVFATGLLHDSGRIGWVGHLEGKLRGFWREYGKKRPLLLTTAQRGHIDALAEKNPCWSLDGLDVHVVDSLADLFNLPAFAKARASLVAAPRTTELDPFMLAMEQDDLGIRFERVADMVAWLLPSASAKPTYAFRLRCKRGQVLLHRGDAPASRADWEAMDTLLADNPESFGAADRIRLAAAWGVYWMDAGDPAEGLRRLDDPSVVDALPHADLAARAEWHGVAAELSRASGNPGRAVEEGWRGLRTAIAGQGHLTGRMANHTVHALLHRARAGRGTARGDDLEAARDLLGDSMGVYAPSLDPHAKEIHLGFCRHMEAEWHRLSGASYTPLPHASPPGIWDHPRLFTLLSAARNPANDPALRRSCASDLCQCAEAARQALQGPVFALLCAVYAVFHAHLRGDPTDAAVDRLEETLCAHPGLLGWPNRLRPALEALQAAAAPEERQAAVDLLCDAIPHH